MLVFTFDFTTVCVHPFRIRHTVINRTYVNNCDKRYWNTQEHKVNGGKRAWLTTTTSSTRLVRSPARLPGWLVQLTNPAWPMSTSVDSSCNPPFPIVHARQLCCRIGLDRSTVRANTRYDLDCGGAVHFGTLNVRGVFGGIPGKGTVEKLLLWFVLYVIKHCRGFIWWKKMCVFWNRSVSAEVLRLFTKYLYQCYFSCRAQEKTSLDYFRGSTTSTCNVSWRERTFW